jgi:dihydrofolate reductase
MRRIINDTFVTLDGVINHMDKWHFDYVDEETHEITLERIRSSDALLMGRHTYDVYASAWPEREGEYPDVINAIGKYVVSSTLTNPTWANTTVVSGDVLDFARELKATDGASILMHGFGPVAKSLVKAGLLDELNLWYHPSLVGLGDANDRLHTDGLHATFTHIGTRTLKSGVVILSYAAA